LHPPASFSIDDSGDLVFRAKFSGGDVGTAEGLFTLNSLLLKTTDVIDGRTLIALRSPSVNNDGEVAFSGVTGQTSIGIFTLNSLIVHEGDVLDDKIIDLPGGASFTE